MEKISSGCGPARAQSSNVRINLVKQQKGVLMGVKKKVALQATEHGVLVSFCRWFLANPDVQLRVMEDIPLNKANFTNIYHSPESATGYMYIDYG